MATRKVLLAVDGSKQAQQAFDYYAQFLHKPENQLILLHCPELSQITTKLAKSGKFTQEEWEKAVEAEKKNWKGIQDKYEVLLKEKSINGTFEVQPSDKPGEAIVDFGQEKQVNFFVMGTRGLGSIRRTFMGSVSDFVVHHAHVPVIVCRN
eukprot:GHVU01003672.1.p1 GENE.GHVU01003672.1~~GHVU01003672.1.p1  ORF type:complete len:151 (+),score=23.65 GHVU01003672.1:223-675(+)